MTVYFIRVRGTNIVKIGSSERPDDRIQQLQVGSPHELELLGTCDSPSDEFSDSDGMSEKYYHRRFANRRIRGEWFRLTNDDLASIEEAEFDPHSLWIRQIELKLEEWYLPSLT